MNLVSRVSEHLKPILAELKPIHGLPDMFERCFLSTLESTCHLREDGSVYIITGDIEAMWLRDSTEQVLHYVHFAAEDQTIADWIEKVIASQIGCVLIDPYANAFNIGPNGRHGYEDTPPPGPHIWERKYELDSLCHVILLAWRYWKATGNTAFLTPDFSLAMEKILDVIQTEQHHMQRSSYRFERKDCPASDTLPFGGMGTPVAFTGMSWSGFRPSDDACAYGYLIPANLFAAAMLEKLAQMLPCLAQRALKLADEIRSGVEKHGVVTSPMGRELYAFETDGLGNHLLMDDANIPSLLSLPYLGICEADDERYLRTRAFVLSRHNPYYYQGRMAQGIGSPHTPAGYIWPIALCVQGLTACDPLERVEVLTQLLVTHGGTQRMHESFDPEQPENYTRSWFAWANSMFGELIYHMYKQGELTNAVHLLIEKGIKDIK